MNLKHLFLTFLFLSLAFPAFSCDICGSGSGSYYIGMLPEFREKIIGLRYRSNALTSHLSPAGKTTYLSTEEQFHTMEVWGGWTIKEKWRIIAQLPLVYNTRKSQEINQAKTGIGDASLSGYYQLINSQRRRDDTSGKNAMAHYLWIGGGVKLPTGRYEPADKNPSASGLNLFQTGSGSWDLMLTGMYETRLSNFGLSLTASYKINTANRYDYYYGNRISGIGQLYYNLRLQRGHVITLHTGLQYEYSLKDLENGYSVHASGGEALYGSYGIEWGRKGWAAGLSWQPVYHQNLGAGTVRSANRTMLHIALLF